jgi:DNA-binding NtrC family response regulator
MSETGNTTSPADPSERIRPRTASDAWALGFVICHHIPDPRRPGEVTLFDPSARRPFVIGRAGVHFFQQRPGEMIDGGRLKGDTISGEQLLVSNEGEGVRVHNVGRAPVFVDGTRVPQHTSVHLLPGAVVEVYGHSIFLVTRRPLSLPHAHRLLLPLQPFGEVDSMGFAGESPLAWQQREDAVTAANAGRNVLVYGQTGTGKDLVARAIHDKSFRAQGPFKVLNCPELTPELAALRLFGGRKNWPNPGTPETVGYFQAAEGGTLFLDEIGEMGEALQAKLLGALESGYTVVGETQRRPIRCVVVAATNRGDVGMKHDVRQRFGILVVTPSLAERREDIAQMISWLLLEKARENTEFAAKFLETDASARPHVRVDASLVSGLLRHPLPGNVRELDGILDMAINQTRGEPPLRWPSRLPLPPPSPLQLVEERPHHSADALMQGLERRPAPTVPPKIVRVESDAVGSGERPHPSRERVLEVLHEKQWRFTKAAEALGISVDKLFRLRDKYGLREP